MATPEFWAVFAGFLMAAWVLFHSTGGGGGD
jgi:hypothetical protein